MIYRAKAPLRLGFGGGGTDVPPYVDEYGGYVLNATINKYVYATLVENDTEKIGIHSVDFEQSISYDCHKSLPYDGNLDLVKAVVNNIKSLSKYKKLEGFDLYIRSDAPPGTGLGTSSTAVVAVIGAMLEACMIKMSCYDIAHLAWKIERHDMKLSGGKQDQYAAAIGGVNFMEFNKLGYTVVNTLRLTKTIINELQHNLLLCYTGHRHNSSNVIKEQIKMTKKRINNLNHLKEIAVAMKDDLLTEDLTNFGELLSLDWQNKRLLSNKVSTPHIDNLVYQATQAGADGIKLTGAGGGGVLIIYCNWKHKTDVAKTMLKNDCQIIDFTITKTGLETWSIK